ncbi:MAG TPA: hypothetical protein VF255_08105 [Solirubrobacterales bacterium]
MFSTLRNRFGIPGVISVIALVFAMIGGAYAASNNGSDNGATASAKKKAPKGPKGAKGATGPTGPAGPAGPAGAKGDAGANGSNGAAGATGTTGVDGKSITTAAAVPSECPVVGGVKVEVEGVPSSKKAICNGKEGSPWTAGGTLPPGETLTGAWSAIAPRETIVNFETEKSTLTADGVTVQAPISFPIPLATATEATYVGKASSAPGCPGIVSGVPTADPGNLCVYTSFQAPAKPDPAVLIIQPIGLLLGASTSGAILQYTCESSTCTLLGSWAVTAPTEA